MILIVIGVCGSGKTTIAEKLASILKWPIAEADDFHSDNNKAKMAAGIPLNDEDRLPWLMSLHEVIQKWIANDTHGIMTCSALKKNYRNILVYGQTEQRNIQPDTLNKILFVHLHGTKDAILERMQSRSGHFMPSTLLDSQLNTLEMPTAEENALMVDIKDSVKITIEQILKHLNTYYAINSQ